MAFCAVSGSGSEGGDSDLNCGGGIQSGGGDVPGLTSSMIELEYNS